MNVIVLGTGIATLALAVLHVVAGGRQVARPMLAASFDVVARDTMHVCWHLVTAQLVLAGVYLIVAGLAPAAGTETLVRAIATLHLAYGAVFLGIAIASRRRRAILQLGQWIAFLPLGIAGWVGGAS